MTRSPFGAAGCIGARPEIWPEARAVTRNAVPRPHARRARPDPADEAEHLTGSPSQAGGNGAAAQGMPRGDSRAGPEPRQPLAVVWWQEPETVGDSRSGPQRPGCQIPGWVFGHRASRRSAWTGQRGSQRSSRPPRQQHGACAPRHAPAGQRPLGEANADRHSVPPLRRSGGRYRAVLAGLYRWAGRSRSRQLRGRPRLQDGRRHAGRANPASVPDTRLG